VKLGTLGTISFSSLWKNEAIESRGMNEMQLCAAAIFLIACASRQQVKPPMNDANLVYKIRQVGPDNRRAPTYLLTVTNKSDVSVAGLTVKSLKAGYQYLKKSVRITQSTFLKVSPSRPAAIKPWGSAEFRAKFAAGTLPRAPHGVFVESLYISASYKTHNTLHEDSETIGP